MNKFADIHVHLQNIDNQRVETLLDTLAKIGITDATLLSVCTMCDFDIISNLVSLYWKEKYKKINLSAFGSFHEIDIYKDIPYEKQAERLLSLGCDGIKFLHMKPFERKQIGKGVNHPSYDRALSMLEERQTPVLIHSGDPETFWDITKVTPYELAHGYYYDSSYLSPQDHYNEDFEMLDKHPKLNVTFAHFFFLSNFPDEVERVFDKYENVRFDLTPGWEMYLGFSKDIDRWQKIFERYSDRIIFGTDSNSTKGYNEAIHDLVYGALTHDKSTFQMPCYGGHTIRGLDLPGDVVEKICYKNYADFVGEKPVPVDTEGLLEYAKEMLSDIKDISGMERSINWLTDFIKNG